MSLTTTGGLVPQTMDQAVRMAELMSAAKTLPAHLQRNPGDCLMVVEQAMRWGMSPFAVAQCTSVIQGKLMFEGKLVAAALHSSGALSSRLAYDYRGEGDAREVVVSATLAAETKPRDVTVRLKDAKTTNGMWVKQPDQQLAYHGARVWARRYAPEVMLGVYAPEEMETPAKPSDTFAGTTIDARAEPQTRDTLNAEVPMPRKRTVTELLAGIDATLAAAETAEALSAAEATPDVVRGLEVLTNRHLEKLKGLLLTHRERVGASAFFEPGTGMET